MEQIIYADILFLVDISMDFLALYLCAKFLRIKTKIKMLLIASTIGALFSVFSVMWHSQSIIVSFIVSVLMCFVAYNGSCLKTKLLCIPIFYGVNMLLGGAMTVLFTIFNKVTQSDRYILIGGEQVSIPSKMPLTVFYIGFIALILIFKAIYSYQNRRPYNNPIILKIDYRGKSYELNVIEDSGNRLCEPISGDPIIFIKEKALLKIVDNGVLSALKMQQQFYFGADKTKFRVVVFNTVGGKDMCVCCRLGEITVNKNKVCAWVAIGKNIDIDGVDGIIPSALIKNGGH